MPLSPGGAAYYVTGMDPLAPRPLNHALIAALIAGGVAFTVVVFAGWMRFGADIVLTYAENGLSSCL